jgi:hypothetical protein
LLLGRVLADPAVVRIDALAYRQENDGAHGHDHAEEHEHHAPGDPGGGRVINIAGCPEAINIRFAMNAEPQQAAPAFILRGKPFAPELARGLSGAP